jgi:hypothetical protein
MTQIHSLKILPEYYQEVEYGNKTFEVRKNDRGYKIGDTLELREYIPDLGYTGHASRFRVKYILHGGEFGIEEGFVMMSIVKVW